MIQPDPDANRRILIIDDNPAIHEDFRKILCSRSDAAALLSKADADMFGDEPVGDRDAGFAVDSPLQGQEGLKRVQQAVQAGLPYAMAFVDVRMPPVGMEFRPLLTFGKSILSCRL